MHREGLKQNVHKKKSKQFRNNQEKLIFVKDVFREKSNALKWPNIAKSQENCKIWKVFGVLV